MRFKIMKLLGYIDVRQLEAAAPSDSRAHRTAVRVGVAARFVLVTDEEREAEGVALPILARAMSEMRFGVAAPLAASADADALEAAAEGVAIDEGRDDAAPLIRLVGGEAGSGRDEGALRADSDDDDDDDFRSRDDEGGATRAGAATAPDDGSRRALALTAPTETEVVVAARRMPVRDLERAGGKPLGAGRAERPRALGAAEDAAAAAAPVAVAVADGVAVEPVLLRAIALCGRTSVAEGGCAWDDEAAGVGCDSWDCAVNRDGGC